MYNAAAGTWLSSGTSTPNVADTAVTATTDPPAGQVTSVAETAETLGLEKYFQYTPMATGAGSELDNNDANGNVVWNYSPFSNPSNGFSTFVRLERPELREARIGRWLLADRCVLRCRRGRRGRRQQPSDQDCQDSHRCRNS